MAKNQGPEQLIKKSIFIYMSRYTDIMCWQNSSVGIFDPVRKIYRKNISPFHIKGTADILGILPGGRFLAIEVKSPKGVVSVDQQEFLNRVNRMGGIGFVARSVLCVQTHLEGVLK